MVPSLWGSVSVLVPFKLPSNGRVCDSAGFYGMGIVLTLVRDVQVDKREDPYAPQQSGGCCSVM